MASMGQFPCSRSKRTKNRANHANRTRDFRPSLKRALASRRPLFDLRLAALLPAARFVLRRRQHAPEGHRQRSHDQARRNAVSRRRHLRHPLRRSLRLAQNGGINAERQRPRAGHGPPSRRRRTRPRRFRQRPARMSRPRARRQFSLPDSARAFRTRVPRNQRPPAPVAAVAEPRSRAEVDANPDPRHLARRRACRRPSARSLRPAETSRLRQQRIQPAFHARRHGQFSRHHA
jgi:hypothetical protein